jgi:putative ABC transport system permease protein
MQTTIRHLLSDVVRDLRYALRSFVKDPAFATVVVVTLALGIGTTTAVFSIVSAVILKPLPYPEPSRIVLLAHIAEASVFPGISAPKFFVWRESTAGFEDAAAYRFPGPMNVATGDHHEQITAGHVTASFFRLFGVHAAIGRTFSEQEDQVGASNVVVLSDGFWRRYFGGAANVVGNTLVLDGDSRVIVGVLSVDFDPRSASPFVAASPDVWVPLQLDPASHSDANNLLVAARLRSGVTIEEAKAQTTVAVAAFREKFPAVLPPTIGLTVAPLEPLVVGNARSSLLFLFGSVAFLLLIVCANVASLMLVRGSGRERELAIQAAVGASRGRIVRQVMMESAVLTAFGGVLGALLGFSSIRAMLALQPGNIPRIAQDGSDITWDWRLVLFALTLTMVSAFLSGLVPALQSSRVDLNASLKSGGNRAGCGLRQHKTRALLVVSEVALASMLLVGAALMVRSFIALQRVDPGFDPHRVLTMRTAATARQYATTGITVEFLDRGLQALRAVPGVEAAAAMLTELPLEGDNANLRIEPATRETDDYVVGSWRIVSPDYFHVFDIRLSRGRLFTTHDNASSPAVVVINQALARRFWPAKDPIGDRILLGRGAGPEFDDKPRQVIGIVADTRQAGLHRDARPAAYVPVAQLPDAGMAFLHGLGGRVTWVMRTNVAPYTIAESVQDGLRRAIGAPVTDVRSMDDMTRSSSARMRFQLWLMAIFGGVAVLLAALGVYGTAAYSVQQRSREIGIRLALGAASTQIRTMVIRQGLGLILLGIIVGMAGAAGLAQLAAGILFGVTPHDRLVFGLVPCLLGVVGLGAVWLPAQRAVRIDPVATLNSE